MFGENEIVKSHKNRSEIIGNIILICFSIILARLWYLQIYKGKEFYKYSLENRLRREPQKAPRGMIYSRNNQMLVRNLPRFDAVIIPQYLKNKNETVKKISKILNVPNSKIQKLIRKSYGKARYQAITIKKNISRKEVAIIETEGAKMPGVVVETFISREYKDKEIGGHLFGYISEINKKQLPKFKKRDKYDYQLGDFIGQFGLEEKFDLDLRGEDGHAFIEVDARGRRRRFLNENNIFKGIENKPALAGNNIRLTIDRDLQLAAFKALEGKVGGAVAIDVETGEVLAMVSRPSFNPSMFSRGLTSEYWSSLVNNENNPLRDRNIQEHYSPGSTFKTFTAIAALEEGIVDEKTEVHCPGYMVFGRRRFHCWKKHGHGKVRLKKALRESCDVYFYKIATKMDIDVLAKYAKAFGFGVKTGINLTREIPGLMPTKEWKKKQTGEVWQQGETLSCVIGQSFVLSTPLQLALAYSAIANGGTLFKPKLIKEVFDNDGKIISTGKIVEHSKITIKKKNMALIKEALYEVVNKRKGTAWWHRGRGLNMAGKTGTSQVIRARSDDVYNKCEELEYKYRHHGLFVSYAPADNPKIAIGVVVEHGCHGSSAAAPVAKAVTTAYMKKYLPEVRKKRIKIEIMAARKRKAAEDKAAEEKLSIELKERG